MRWAVEIQNTSLNERNLGDLLNSIGFVLVQGARYPAFTSPEINECDTYLEAYEIGKQLRSTFMGSQVDPIFSLAGVIDYSLDPPASHEFVTPDPVVAELTVCDPTVSILPPEDLSDTELQEWEFQNAEIEYQNELETQSIRLAAVFNSPNAEKVLTRLAVERPSGNVIYEIYELMEGHPRNRVDFQSQFGITKIDFNRFRDSVHNHSVSGDWARHTYNEEPRTENPMTKNEAESFVRYIAEKWLRHEAIK